MCRFVHPCIAVRKAIHVACSKYAVSTSETHTLHLSTCSPGPTRSGPSGASRHVFIELVVMYTSLSLISIFFLIFSLDLIVKNLFVDSFCVHSIGLWTIDQCPYVRVVAIVRSRRIARRLQP